MIRFDALGKVPGDNHSVIILGINEHSVLCLHVDGSMGWYRLETVKLNALETAVRFKGLEEYNTDLATEAIGSNHDH